MNIPNTYETQPKSQNKEKETMSKRVLMFVQNGKTDKEKKT